MGLETAAGSLWRTLLPLVVLGLGCSPAGDSTSVVSSSLPNVLLISLDALRSDHLGAYGYGRETSPFLDDFAASGTRFENSFINTLGTTPSHTTILSSQYQETHRMDYTPPEGGLIASIPSDVVMLQEVLRDRGYSTIGITAGGNVHERFGFDRGFDSFDSGARSVEKGVELLLSQLPERIDEPTFIFYHTYEIHSNYRPPREYRNRFGSFEARFLPTSRELIEWNKRGLEGITEQDIAFLVSRYDAEIRYTDDTLRILFAELEARGFFDDYLVVITSDHGEEFGEHGHFLHQGFLYEELLRVPLILGGSRVPAAVRSELVSSIDIAPTILDHVGVAIPDRMSGRPLLSAEVAPEILFAQYGPRRYAARTHGWKLIENKVPGTVELYDMTNDPGEMNDLSSQLPDRVSELGRQLEQFRQQRIPPPRELATVEIDPELEERLRALGYL